MIKNKIIKRFKYEWQLWAISIPIIAWAVCFCYVPMYGLVSAFYEYVPGLSVFSGKFIGLKYIMEFIKSTDFGLIMRNTLVISGLGITIGFISPIILALFINELRNRRFKRTVQSISYIPYFVSMVVVAAIIMDLLSLDGTINHILLSFGIIKEPIAFLMEGKYFWFIMLAVNIWKSVGFSSILYLAAIAGIDSQLYEAGAVDGLNRWGKVIHITLPGIMPTIIVLFILAFGSILNSGFEYQLLIGNVYTAEYHEVIDTYVYRYGVQLGRYSYGTAVGLVKGLVALLLVFGANHFSKKLTDISII